MWLRFRAKRRTPARPFAKQVGVYARRKDIVIMAYHWTDVGYLMAGLPAIRIALESRPEELGVTTKDILTASGKVVPTPLRDQHKARSQPLLNALGARKWSDIESHARLCFIRQLNSGELRIVPTKNGGGRGENRGFHELKDLALTTSADVTPNDWEMPSSAGCRCRSDVDVSSLHRQLHLRRFGWSCRIDDRSRRGPAWIVDWRGDWRPGWVRRGRRSRPCA